MLRLCAIYIERDRQNILSVHLNEFGEITSA